MNYLYAIIFGITQGLTEFLPVSSSGHLVLLHELFNLPIINEMLFDVYLHLATLFAVIIFFKNDILKLIIGFFNNLDKEKRKINPYSRLSLLIIASTVPAALAGYFLENSIIKFLRSAETVAIMLIFIGVLFIIIEKKSNQYKTIKEINLKSALTIGFAQTIALIPGTSRSGITIVAGLANNLKREEAIRFSFLLSIPIITGAAITKIPMILNVNISQTELSVLIVAFLSAFISGFLAIKYFIKFAERHTLKTFAYYRFVLAFIIIVFGLI